MHFKKTTLALSLMMAVSAAQAAPSNEEIWLKLQEIQGQLSSVQQQNATLKAENASLKTQAVETNAAVEAVAESAETAMKTQGNSATTIGGYGELHYNNLDDQHGTADVDAMDFHRFVLFFGHEFNDRLRFFSELELEHSLAGEGKPGEVEIEQAYLQYDLNDRHSVTAGLFLTPVGIMNETHEPATFYGTERNAVEKHIIPSTWWEGGLMFSGEIAQGFSYDVAATTGLSASAAKNYTVRKGRQKVAKADAEDFAYTARLRWTGIPGVELGATVQYQSDITQSLDATAGSATLFETHAVINRGNFGLRALYATWDLDGSGPKSVGADEQTGWYVEPSYKFSKNVGVFARYSEWDNRAGDAADSEYGQFDIGVNWWLHEDVVVKFDYQDQSAPDSSKELDGFNVGIGYEF